MEFNTGLTRFGQQTRLHAKLVNTFSLMEYIGARKILKSQAEASVSEALLLHAAEEMRHAITLKRLALKMSEGHLTHYSAEHTLGQHAGQIYLQKVDLAAAEVLKSINPYQNYLITTWLIEARALMIYPAYEKILSALGYPGFLTGILKDEEKHAGFIDVALKDEAPVNENQIHHLLKIENQAFALFCESVFSGSSK